MRFLKSVIYAWQGIKYCFKSEKNFQIQSVVSLITLAAGFLFKINTSEWIAVLLCIALVQGLEMVNSAIEKLSNVVTESIHPIIKLVKDIAAGAVLFVSIISFIIGCIIFLPKIELLVEYFLK
jgi:diacylglycerol kinase